jgi:hypothetical protein
MIESNLSDEPAPFSLLPASFGPPPLEVDPHGPFFSAIFITLKRILFHPVKFYQALPSGGGIGIPLSYTLVVGTFGWVIGLFWQILALLTMDTLIGLPTALSRYGIKALFLIMLFTPLIIIASLLISSLLIHLGILIFCARPQKYQTTFRVMAYAQTGHLIRVFPLIGGLAATFWVAGLEWIGLRILHQTSYPRILASLIFPLVLGFFFWFGIFLFLRFLV